ncbi:hypothetical protein [Eubacterium ventriosum]|uniref:hypothetical protein n=1 Tax=Eubacterium ventriosum TaxID=39496 RepID=UPI003AB49CC8
MSKRRTTTATINNLITNGIIQPVKVESYDKEHSSVVSPVNPDSFIESIQFLNEASYLSDSVDWQCEINGDDTITVDVGRLNPYMSHVTVGQFRLCDGHSIDEVENKILQDVA